MQNLQKEQIKFIDNYLQKSDVIFVDIRAELTDHIASAELYQNEIVLVILSTFAVLYFLIAFIILKVIPSKTQQYLIETYPEIEMSK
jgi:ATP/ADP translocase